MRGSFFLVVPACFLLGVACGGDSKSSGKNGEPDAADGAGGLPGAGSGGAPGSGGTSSGGAQGSGGLPSAGGSPALDAGPCAPAGPGQTALCVTLVPEEITAETDSALDKRGVLYVQVFNTPNPPDSAADRIALAGAVLPLTAANGDEVSLDALTPVRLVGAFPATVYLRAFFLDNATELDGGIGIAYGTWIGGTDLSRGISENMPLSPVTITPGVGNAVELGLTALRKLEVTVSRSGVPVGDGEGPLDVVVLGREDPSTGPAVFGIAQARCTSLATGSVTVTGAVVGAGPYFVTGVLNDLGLPGDFPPGSIAAFVLGDSGAPRIPSRLSFRATDYSVTGSIDLAIVSPFPADAGAVPPNACVDLFPPQPADGGTIPDGGSATLDAALDSNVSD